MPTHPPSITTTHSFLPGTGAKSWAKDTFKENQTEQKVRQRGFWNGHVHVLHAATVPVLLFS
jgi:hypothetical protein